MRAVLLVAILTVMAGCGPGLAQSATEGPLAAPDPRPVTKPAKPRHRKLAKTARSSAAKDSGGSESAADSQPATPGPGTSLPANSVDFGMKWNGSNDSARDTRVQNYDGSAQGTGAEVGMKLHF